MIALYTQLPGNNMDMILSNRTQQVKPSPTLALNARVAELKAAGHDVIGLAVGEPDFDTPPHICEAAIEAIHNGLTRYTAVDGIAPLKQAIIEKFHRENQLNYRPENVMAASGAKQVLYNLMQALLNEGDEVLIPCPYWVSYPAMVTLASATPMYIKTDIQQHFKITPNQLEHAITPRTRLLILNSPSNPSGVLYSKTELAALGEVLVKYPKIIIASDDIYEHIHWTKGPFVNILNACPALYGRTLVINGVSKAYAMTGWRIGYAAGPKPLIQVMKNIQSQSTSNPNSIAQAAAVAALTGDQSSLKERCAIYQQRHELVLSALKQIPDIQVSPSDGTFYIFPNVEALLQKHGLATDMELAEDLLEKAGVAVVPGSVFGNPGHLRISFATDENTLRLAMERIQNLFRK